MPAHARVSEVRTYRLIEELVEVQGWLFRGSGYRLLAQQEFRDVPTLKAALSAGSKTGGGGGVPEYLLVHASTGTPVAVFEGKARVEQLAKAVKEACAYGDELVCAGFNPVAIAVAGTNDSTFAVRVLSRQKSGWAPITYEGAPIGWVPGPDEMERIRAGAQELRPRVPRPEVLKEKAEEINGLLRQSGLKDDYRPSAIGAIMLALWKDGPNIRRDADHILRDVNDACARAFKDAGKADLSHSIYVDTANAKLAVNARRIAQILERLNITTLTAEHDYIGSLYEEFFRYAGGNTIGQYFTPRHVARFMADLCEVTADDKVLDVACGTGGFLIAAMQRMQEASHLSRAQVIRLVGTQLIGLETEPVTAALCVANMILRGDGTTGIRRMDAFDDQGFPFEAADVALMNPPFPHKKTDVPTERFIDRALEGLSKRSLCAAVVPMSLLVKKTHTKWREGLLKKNKLEAVFTLPDELFQPYASATTAIILIRKGVPQKGEYTFFCRIANDGFRLKKGTRVPTEGGEMERALSTWRQRHECPEFSGMAQPTEKAGAWHPGAHIPSAPMGDAVCKQLAGRVIRNHTAFVARFAPEIVAMQDALDDPQQGVEFENHRGKAVLAPVDTIGAFFTISYGQKALHSKEHLVAGQSLVISSSGSDNGCYGFFDFQPLLRPPFVTVPSTGSIGESAVQTLPCGVSDDCLVLVPKSDTPPELLYVAAAGLRNEAWRFDYGRKMTPARIAQFELPTGVDLLRWIRAEVDKASEVEDLLIEFVESDADESEREDQLDAQIALDVLEQVRAGAMARVSGEALGSRLNAILDDL